MKGQKNHYFRHVVKKLAFEGGRFYSILNEFRLIGGDSQDFLKLFYHFTYGDGLHRKNLRVQRIHFRNRSCWHPTHNKRLLKNCFLFVILSEAKNLSAQFEKKNEILRRGGKPPLLRMTRLRYFSEASISKSWD